MRAQRLATASTLGLLGLLAVAYGGLQTVGSEVQHRADPPSLAGEIIETVEDVTNELSVDDMHW